MEINRCFLQIVFFASLSFGYSQSDYLNNTHWIQKYRDCSDYFPCTVEYFFYSNGRFLEKNTVKNGTISSVYKGKWELINDSLHLFPDTILSYSKKWDVYYRKSSAVSLKKESFKIKFKYCLFMPKLFLFQEDQNFKVKRKFKKRKTFNDSLKLGAKIEDIEYLDTTQ